MNNSKKVKWGIGKEIKSLFGAPYEKCPKCKGYFLVPRNGSTPLTGFVQGSSNYWKCTNCKREFEVIEYFKNEHTN